MADAEVIEEDDEDVHTWFSLTYANYLVLPRSLMQSMPLDWQHRMVQCLREIDAAFDYLDKPASYSVQPRDLATGQYVKETVPHYSRGRTHVLRWDELTAEEKEAAERARRQRWGLDA